MSEVKRSMLYASPVAGGMVMIEATPELRAQYPKAKVYVEDQHLDRVTAERDAERRRADVAVADANAADAAGNKVSELLSNRTAERDALQALLTAADERVDVLEGLSVTKILLDIVPGDGSGHEIYAKSIEEVEAALTKLCDEVEKLTYQNEKLVTRLGRSIELLRGTHTGDLFGPEDWETIDTFLNIEARP